MTLLVSGCSIYGDANLGELANDTSLIAYYPFNGNVADATGNGHDGYMYNVTSTTDRFYIFNRAFYFDGPNASYIGIDPANGFNLSGKNFTISAWIYDSAGSSNKMIVSIDSASVPFIELYINSSLYCIFSINGYAANSTQQIYGASWYHIAAVWNGITQRIYINGILDVEYSPGMVFNTVPGTYKMTIGTDTAFSGFFNGTIDEVAIFSRALSADEISRLYYSSN